MATEKQDNDLLASSGSASDIEVVPGSIDEKKLLRRLDLRLLPAVSILYLLSFLDRSNGTYQNKKNSEKPLGDACHDVLI